MVKRIMVIWIVSSFFISSGGSSFASHYKGEKEKFKFFPYLWSKICEIPQMKITHDFRLLQINHHIRKHKKSRHFLYVNLNKLKQIHPVTRPRSLEKVERRVKALKESYFAFPKISHEQYQKAMPSITPIQVAKFEEDSYYVFEGNSRLISLKKAFLEQKIGNLMIEVEVFDLTGNRKLLKKIKVLRKKNGLAKQPVY